MNELFSFINHNLPLMTFINSVITFLLGLFFGNRYALNRDKRKEFNAILDPIKTTLRQQLDSIYNAELYHKSVPPHIMMALTDRLPKKKRDAVLDAYDDYLKETSVSAMRTTNSEGYPITQNFTEAVTAINTLLALLKNQ